MTSPVAAIPASDSLRRASSVLLLVALAGGFGALALRTLGDFDLPWHLALGRVIAARQAIPARDPLALLASPIQHVEVVSDLSLWFAYRSAGPLGLQLFGALVAVATAVTMYVVAGPKGTAAPAVVALAFAAMNPWLIVRPALVSFLLVAVELWLLDRHRADPARRRHHLLWLAPLSALWANAHGFVVIGLAVAWLYALYRAACWLVRGRLPLWLPRADGRLAGNTLAAVALATVAACFNVAGPKLLLGPVRAMHDFGAVTEWARPDLRFLLQTEPASGVLLLVLLVSLLAGREPTTGRRALPAFEAGLLVLALVLAASAVRLIPVGAVLASGVIARRLAPRLPARPSARFVAALSTLLVVPWLLLQTDTRLGVGFEPRNHPERAVRWVEQHEPVGNLWNFSPYGGYLSLRLYPRYRVLIDGRTGWVHDPGFTERVRQSELDVRVFRELVGELDLEWAVTRAIEGEPFGTAVAKAEEFAMVYLDDFSAIYVRRTGPNEALARTGYRALRHLMPPAFVLHAAMRGTIPAEDLAHDGALAARQDPTSARGAFFDACGRLAARDRGGFERAVDALRRLAPGNEAIAMLEQAWGERAAP